MNLLGGSQTSETKVPPYIEEQAKRVIDQGNRTAEIGYMPYYGPDVAPLMKGHHTARENLNDMASAFGMGTMESSLPAAQDFGGGVWGHSSGGLFDNAMAELKARRPGQYGAMMDLFIDPQTGAAPAYQQQQQQQQEPQQNPNYNAGDAAIYGSWYNDHFAGHGGPGGFAAPGAQGGGGGFGDFFGGVGDAVGSIGGFFGGPSERW